MKTSDVIKTHTVILDLSLNILVSSVKEVVGMNLYNLIQYQKMATKDGILSLKEYQTYTTDTILSTTEDRGNAYRMVVIKGINLYYVTLILLDTINEMVGNYEQLENYAYTDQLTGALNRHAYSRLLESTLYELDRQNLGLGILFIDVDDLKGINSQNGYQAGDASIKLVAGSIDHCLRKSDIYIRYGGDEFLALFRVDPKKDFTVDDMAGRILNRVKRDSGGKVTVSIGGEYLKPGVVSTLSKSSKWLKDWEKLLNDLDSKLKKAKREGKGRAIL